MVSAEYRNGHEPKRAVVLYDLATGKRLILRTIDAREIRAANPGRYVDHAPSPDELAAFAEENPEAVAEANPPPPSREPLCPPDGSPLVPEWPQPAQGEPLPVRPDQRPLPASGQIAIPDRSPLPPRAPTERLSDD